MVCVLFRRALKPHRGNWTKGRKSTAAEDCLSGSHTSSSDAVSGSRTTFCDAVSGSVRVLVMLCLLLTPVLLMMCLGPTPFLVMLCLGPILVLVLLCLCPYEFLWCCVWIHKSSCDAVSGSISVLVMLSGSTLALMMLKMFFSLVWLPVLVMLKVIWALSGSQFV